MLVSFAPLNNKIDRALQENWDDNKPPRVGFARHNGNILHAFGRYRVQFKVSGWWIIVNPIEDTSPLLHLFRYPIWGYLRGNEVVSSIKEFNRLKVSRSRRYATVYETTNSKVTSPYCKYPKNDFTSLLCRNTSKMIAVVASMVSVLEDHLVRCPNPWSRRCLCSTSFHTETTSHESWGSHWSFLSHPWMIRLHFLELHMSDYIHLEDWKPRLQMESHDPFCVLPFQLCSSSQQKKKLRCTLKRFLGACWTIDIPINVNITQHLEILFWNKEF